MKIGFEAKRVYHNTTGLGNYSRDLVRGLAKFYPQNQYYLYNPKPRKEILFSTDDQSITQKLPSSKFFKKFKNYWRQKGIVNDLILDNISVFHGLSGELPAGLRKNKIKSVVTIHDLIFVRYPKLYSFFDRKIHFIKFKKAVQQADIVIAISEQTKRDIIDFLHVDENKIRVIYQSCHNAFKQEYSNDLKELVKSTYKLPESFVLNVGTLEERKNAFHIVKAIKDIDTTLVLIGRETSYSDQIRSYIKANNIENKVLFLKNIPLEDLVIIYQLATVFVYPSIFEGFGIPIIEALYSKTPVITTNSGVFPEAGGPYSIYVDPGNIEEIKNQIQYLLESESLQLKLAENGYEYVQKFSEENQAKQVMEIYKALVK